MTTENNLTATFKNVKKKTTMQVSTHSTKHLKTARKYSASGQM